MLYICYIGEQKWAKGLRHSAVPLSDVKRMSRKCCVCQHERITDISKSCACCIFVTLMSKSGDTLIFFMGSACLPTAPIRSNMLARSGRPNSLAHAALTASAAHPAHSAQAACPAKVAYAAHRVHHHIDSTCGARRMAALRRMRHTPHYTARRATSRQRRKRVVAKRVAAPAAASEPSSGSRDSS